MDRILALWRSLDSFDTESLKKKAKSLGQLKRPVWPEFNDHESLMVMTLDRCMGEVVNCMKGCGKLLGIDAAAASVWMRPLVDSKQRDLVLGGTATL